MEPLFVYINKIGDIRVEDVDGALSVNIGIYDWRLIATIVPKSYLCTTLNKNAKLVAALMKEGKV